jgi:hypothetical protein
MKMINTATRRGLLALPILACLALPALAQTPVIQAVTRFRVKPDRVADFRAAVMDYSALLKKANVDESSYWMVAQSGEPLFLLIRRYNGYAGLDTVNNPKLKDVSADLARALARENSCVESRERTISEILPDLSLPASAEMPKMVRVLWSTVKPDRLNDYMDMVKSDIVPAMKKAGVKFYMTTRVRYGGATNVFVSAQGIDSWADLDKPSPLVQSLGQDGYRKVMDKRAQMITASEAQVVRYQPALSYVAPPR